MFALVVRFTVKPDCEDEFDDLVAATVTEIERCETGTLVYISHRVEDSPRVRIFYELYRDRAAFDAHEQQPHIRQFLAQRERLLDSVQVDFVSPAATARALMP